MDTILRLTNITKSFHGNIVLDNVNFELKKGEIHAIVGENGSGKSTLVKILSGIYSKDSGVILFEGKEINIKNPASSLKYGITTIQQDPFLFEHLTVAENILAQNLPVKNRVLNTIHKKLAFEKAQYMLDELEFPIKSTMPVSMLNLGQKRMVEIAKALSQDSKVIILDEPTASLSSIETESLLKLIKKLRSQGISMIFISQRFEEIIRTVDRITVLRDGIVTGCIEADSADFKKLVKMMSGDCLCDRYPKLRVKHGSEILAVEGLSSGNYIDDVSFTLAEGEILGITGMVGAGRTKLARVIFGLEQKSSGTFYIDRLAASISSPRDAINLGIAYVTEDRFSEGLFGNLNILGNVFSIENIQDKKFIIDSRVENKLLEKYVKKANIDVSSTDRKVQELSGGNQQKVMLLRWFLNVAKIIIFDEPTRGVDITSKVDIYNLMNDLVRKGASVILISTDIEELIGMCDRVIVMRNGGVAAELLRRELNYEKIYHYATGK